MAVSVRVRLVGVFRVLSGTNLVRVTLEEGSTIRDVVQKLAASFPPEFGETLVDPVSRELWPSALILVDGKEIGVLEGVGTVVGENNEVVFVPVTHGG